MFSTYLSETQKAAIADVTIASAEIEAELERCIIELCRLWYPHGLVILGGARLGAKVDMLFQLLELEFKGAKLPDNFRFLKDQLLSLNAQRNTIVHGEWIVRGLTDPDTTPEAFARALETKDVVVRSQNKKRASLSISATDLRRIADLLTLSRELLHQLFYDHFPDRVRGLAGLPRGARSAEQIREAMRKNPGIKK